VLISVQIRQRWQGSVHFGMQRQSFFGHEDGLAQRAAKKAVGGGWVWGAEGRSTTFHRAELVNAKSGDATRPGKDEHKIQIDL
jgi:hypothetical protein